MTIDLVAGAAGVLVGAAITFTALRAAPPTAPLSEPPGQTPRFDDDERAIRILAALPFAALLLDGTGAVRFLNPAAAALFRIDSERARGRQLIAVVPSVELERLVARAIRGDHATRDIIVADGGKERTFGFTAHPFESGAVAIAVDRTDLLANEHVRREFVANVSHELRTPLSAIKLMLETVLMSDDDAEARTLFLPQVSREVDRMIRLIEDLLELARSESGNVLLRRDVFDLTDIATSVVNTFAQRSSTIAVDLDLDAPEAVFVDADRNRLTQVALNLVDNALRHTPPGGTVAVEVARDADAAILRVRDTGAGIPYNDLPHIFERFYVVDRSRSREHAGTGLGLSIARHLVEAHAGTLSAESVYGQGATFTCRLPALALDANIKSR